MTLHVPDNPHFPLSLQTRQSLREELAELEGSAAEQEKLRRQIQDLLAYRRSLSQEEGMAQELASLAQTMGAEVVLVRMGGRFDHGTSRHGEELCVFLTPALLGIKSHHAAGGQGLSLHAAGLGAMAPHSPDT